jgi:hypothetical protein
MPFKGVYSDGTRPKIYANGAPIAFNVGDTKGVTISDLSISGTKGGDWCEPECGVPSRRTVGTSTSLT